MTSAMRRPIAEAVQRPTMRFVATKTGDQRQRFRAIATGYDKLGRNFLVGVQLAILLN